MMHATWSYPTAIRSGSGRVSETGEACFDAGITNPLIVTDPGLVDLPPVLDANVPPQPMMEHLGTNGMHPIDFIHMTQPITTLNKSDHNKLPCWNDGIMTRESAPIYSVNLPNRQF